MPELTQEQARLQQDLRQLEIFKGFPEYHFQRLVEQGTEVRFEPDDRLIREGDPGDYWYILLEGEIRLTKRLQGQDEFLTTYVPGMFFGEVPLLMETPYVATARALTACRLYRLGKERFWPLITSCQYLARTILRTMALRVNALSSTAQQHEKLISLGTLAAGMAHELNNPASASKRAAGQLHGVLQEFPVRNLQLMQTGLTAEQMAGLTQLVKEAQERAGDAPACDPILQSEQEDALANWLETRGVANHWKLAPSFVEAGLQIEMLETLQQQLRPEQQNDAFTWLASLLDALRLSDEVAQSAARISDLVDAMKEYTFMDQADRQEVDVHQGLERTLTMLSYKIEDGMTIQREYDHNLPCISAYGSELNQVWTNLIDNALDAIAENGVITLRTCPDHEYALIEICDNGQGIPPEIMGRLFEPFYTTKEVGKGTGLGLYAAYRTVYKHGGNLNVESKPGETRFQVRLPVSPEEQASK